MKVIVGLGNPGEKYKNTRHNAGFMVVDKIKNLYGGAGWENDHEFEFCRAARASLLYLVKPTAYMNNSGRSLESFRRRFGDFALSGSDFLLIHDDLDIHFPDFKFSFGKGPSSHNGVLDVERVLGTQDYWHLRLGVDNRNGSREVSGEEYVLRDFSKEEMAVLADKIEVEVIPQIRTRGFLD